MRGIFDRHISGGAGKVIQYVFWVSFPESEIRLLVSYICKCRQACLLVPQLNPNVVEPKLVWRKRDRESAKVAIIDCA